MIDLSFAFGITVAVDRFNSNGIAGVAEGK
jgi:hypothetical protein